MRRTNPGFTRARLWVLATVVTIGACMAQNPPASAQGMPAACDGADGNASSTASVVQATGESLQRKRWQPQGGVIQFTIRSFPAIPEKASFYVCFRWKTLPPTDVVVGPPDGTVAQKDAAVTPKDAAVAQGRAVAPKDAAAPQKDATVHRATEAYLQVRPDRSTATMTAPPGR